MKPETAIRLARRLLEIFCHLHIEGGENVPRYGAAIFAINHLGLLDPALGYAAANRRDATGWIADKHKKNPILAYLVNSLGGIWIDRDHVDLHALRKALQAVKHGRLFGLAPEGTRSPTGALIQAKEGVSYLAITTGAAVIPGAITGTEDAHRTWMRFKRPTIGIRIGQPFHLPPLLLTDNRQEALARGTDEIMCRIAALLPERYRGVYSDHPRLKELLANPT